MSEFLSYAQFLKDRSEFRKSGTKSGSDFNIYDTPSHKYFKIIFYFGDVSVGASIEGLSSGLLHPTWEIFNNASAGTQKLLNLHYYDYNSAWSYLKLNNEEERAEKLERFVTLLSNINTYSPWYFKSISGLDSALERKPADFGASFEIGEPKTLTISCMPDAFDNRIGTLLDLYRDITWSWINKKEILPANLRKFDMAVYIYESPINFWHDFENDALDVKDRYVPSYKMLEFHDCEFIYNSVKSGYGDINNENGITPVFNIDITYSDCYEISYNEILMRSIGDVIATDTYQAIVNENGASTKVESEAQKDSTHQINGLKEKMELASKNSTPYFEDSEEVYSFGNIEYSRETNGTPIYDSNGRRIVPKEIIKESDLPKPGFLGNVAEQLYHTGRQHIDNALYEKTGYTTNLKRALLGNLYTYSLTNIGSQLGELTKGNIVKTGQSVKQYIDNAQERAAARVKKSVNLGNLYKNTITNN